MSGSRRPVVIWGFRFCREALFPVFRFFLIVTIIRIHTWIRVPKLPSMVP